MNISLDNVLVTYKKSRFELYSNSPEQETRDFANGNSKDAIFLRKSHDIQSRSMENLEKILRNARINYDLTFRADVESTKGRTFIISAGGDGTLLDVNHYITNVPVIGVNTDPNKSIGFYCACNVDGFTKILDELDKAPITILNRLQLNIDGEDKSDQVLNDVYFKNARDLPAHFLLETKEKGEYKHPPCSGLLVCTASGSSARMANNRGILMPLSSNKIQYRPVEYIYAESKLTLELELTSLTRTGLLQVDGGFVSYPLTLGQKLSIKSGVPLYIVGNLEENRQKLISKNWSLFDRVVRAAVYSTKVNAARVAKQTAQYFGRDS